MNALLIDDHPMVNSGIAGILEETGRFKVTGQTNTLKEAKQFIETNKNAFPSLIILDIMLNEENGLDFLPFLENFCKSNEIKKPYVLVCFVLDEPFRIQSALEMGAAGFISKVSSKTELLLAIDTVLRGETYISGEHSDKVAKSYGLYSKFTRREREILNLIKSNKSNKQIASELFLNIRTIENHISNIYYKTGTKNRQDLQKL
ncbi:MAG: response regulator transcription factor [Treponema sp.]|nr:response regulator transcription factor [Treponema sp.]MCL2272944.1 response regulator transcription factor [Treponema sp.]